MSAPTVETTPSGSMRSTPARPGQPGAPNLLLLLNLTPVGDPRNHTSPRPHAHTYTGHSPLKWQQPRSLLEGSPSGWLHRQPKSLIFDLEVAPCKADQPDRIFIVGALRFDVALWLDDTETAFPRSRGRA